MPTFTEYYAIAYQGEIVLVAPDPQHPTHLHWSGNRSYMTWKPAEIDPLKVYKVAEYPDTDALELAFCTDFCPNPVTPGQDYGWIDREGRFYYCRWTDHERLATRLSGAYYGKLSGANELTRRGWIKVYADGCMLYDMAYHHLTEAQLNCLGQFLELGDEAYQAKIRDILEYEREI